MGELRWRGVALSELDNATLLDAHGQALAICAAMWAELARRGLVLEAAKEKPPAPKRRGSGSES